MHHRLANTCLYLTLHLQHLTLHLQLLREDMDVSANTFRSVLPSTLGAISRAHFVSFDLELSGIPGRQTGQQRPPGQSGDGKQTLQERYQETKKAAERYQVLQLGLTCVEEDTERGKF